jgi:uncharacterized delta-60 repeat protein
LKILWEISAQWSSEEEVSMTKRRWEVVILALFLLAIWIGCGGGDDSSGGTFIPAAGILDDTFGGDADSDNTPDGYAVFHGNNNDYGFGIAPGVNGAIYVAGSYDRAENDMALWRYTSSGVLDTTFGPDDNPADGTPDGFAAYDRGSYDTGYAVALDPDGRVYVAGHTHGGSSNYDMTLWRYDGAGTLDASFGSSGIVMHDGAADAGKNESGVAIALDQDGRIYVAGYSRDSGGVDHMTTWRYTSSGVLDTTFGSPDGFVLYNGGGGNYYGQAVTYDPSAGRVYVAGYRDAANQDLALLCYDSDGILDTSFAADGILIHDGASAGDNAAGLAVSLDSAGRVYVAGANQADSIVWRFASDGALDTTFGPDASPADGAPDGFVTHNNAAGGNGTDEARSITLDPSGLVYVTGNSRGTNEDMVLWRYTSSGILDTTFGGDFNPADGIPDGFVVQAGTAGGNGVDRGTSVAVGTIDNDKVYVVGYSENSTWNFDMVLWRFR